jgi:hypothetical protein
VEEARWRGGVWALGRRGGGGGIQSTPQVKEGALLGRFARLQLPVTWTNQRPENSQRIASGELLYRS